VSITAARQQLEAAGLTLGRVSGQPSDQAKDVVLSQAVPAGTQVAGGSAVDITVSVGLTAATVPNVMGLKAADAAKALKAAKLAGGAVTEEGSAQPKGSVIKQTPAAGASADPGSKVDLVLSSGKTTVQVPKLRGMSEGRALDKLKELGLKGRTSEIFHDSLPKGHVIRTRPSEGKEVDKGAAIKVYVVE
jgi:serine/threonine-protein kinase